MTRVDGSGVEADAEAHAAMEVGEGQASAAVTSGSTTTNSGSTCKLINPPRDIAPTATKPALRSPAGAHHREHVRAHQSRPGTRAWWWARCIGLLALCTMMTMFVRLSTIDSMRLYNLYKQFEELVL